MKELPPLPARVEPGCWMDAPLPKRMLEEPPHTHVLTAHPAGIRSDTPTSEAFPTNW
ncbi:hypothetical protein QJS10_CPA02g00947 [Acorus calamus]|uniref:Uncharacterized protein n=1 Tax=Acorus calamus TaxID=4465 RepID=A0AAV9FDB2_ACOCL|nr:hypothetical protein QJS10_CPA02g00947 [Acorus calamus]